MYTRSALMQNPTTSLAKNSMPQDVLLIRQSADCLTACPQTPDADPKVPFKN